MTWYYDITVTLVLLYNSGTKKLSFIDTCCGLSDEMCVHTSKSEHREGPKHPCSTELQPRPRICLENPSHPFAVRGGGSRCMNRVTENDNWNQLVIFHYICFLYMLGTVHTKLLLDYLSSWFLSTTIYAYSTNNSLLWENRDHRKTVVDINLRDTKPLSPISDLNWFNTLYWY